MWLFQRWSEAVLIKLISKIPIKFCNTCRWVHLTNCMTHLYVRWNSNYSMKYVLIFKNYNNLHYTYICSYLHLPVWYITALIYFSKLRCFSFVCVWFFSFSDFLLTCIRLGCSGCFTKYLQGHILVVLSGKSVPRMQCNRPFRLTGSVYGKE